MNMSLRNITAPCILALATGLAACSADPGTDTETSPTSEEGAQVSGPEIDLEASAPQGGRLEQIDEMQPREGVEFGALPGDEILAQVNVSETHQITFWQTASGRITVIESGNVDTDQGAKLQGFRAGRDSFAAAYTSVAGDAADPAAVERLAAADAVRAEMRVQRGIDGSELNPSDAVPLFQSSLVTTDGLAFKGVAEDKAWWQTICTQRNRYFTGEDQTLCYTASLTPAAGYWRVTLPVNDFEEANIMMLNADTVGVANLYVAGYDCGFLELGLCSGLINRYLDVLPRHYNHLYNESDDGFYTSAQGKALALHYVFWD